MYRRVMWGTPCTLVCECELVAKSDTGAPKRHLRLGSTSDDKKTMWWQMANAETVRRHCCVVCND